MDTSENGCASMTREEFNDFCQAMPATTHVVQWGGSDVWKVGGKVFAICGWGEGDAPAFTFKTSEIGFEMLRDCPGCRPAPYLASRGFKWIQRYAKGGLDDEGLRDHLSQSYDLVVAKLTAKKRASLGV